MLGKYNGKFTAWFLYPWPLEVGPCLNGEDSLTVFSLTEGLTECIMWKWGFRQSWECYLLERASSGAGTGFSCSLVHVGFFTLLPTLLLFCIASHGLQLNAICCGDKCCHSWSCMVPGSVSGLLPPAEEIFGFSSAEEAWEKSWIRLQTL